jgi:hypothetical protein
MGEIMRSTVVGGSALFVALLASFVSPEAKQLIQLGLLGGIYAALLFKL